MVVIIFLPAQPYKMSSTSMEEGTKANMRLRPKDTFCHKLVHLEPSLSHKKLSKPFLGLLKKNS